MDTLRIEQLVIHESNRKDFSKEKMAELVASIKEKGIIEPLVVRGVNLDPNLKKGLMVPFVAYEIIAGARRYTAAKELKLKDVPARIIEATDEEAAQMRIISNLQREDVTPLEEAAGYQLMLKQFGQTLEQVAQKLAKPASYIRSRLALLTLPKEVLDARKKGELVDAHLVVIAKVKGEHQQTKLFKEIGKCNLDPADAERTMLGMLHSSDLSFAIFDKKPCAACEHNAERQPSVFGQDTESSRCMNPQCYAEKTEAALLKKKAGIAKKGELMLTKTEAKKEKVKIIPTGYGGFSEGQLKKCRKCKSFVAVISAGFGASNYTREGGCSDRECFEKCKAAAKESHETGRETPEQAKAREVKQVAAKLIERMEQTVILERMDKLTALRVACIALEVHDSDTQFPKKPTLENMLKLMTATAAIWAAERAARGWGFDKNELMGWLKVPPKALKDFVFDAEGIKKMEDRPRDVEVEEVIAALKKMGYKVTGGGK